MLIGSALRFPLAVIGSEFFKPEKVNVKAGLAEPYVLLLLSEVILKFALFTVNVPGVRVVL